MSAGSPFHSARVRLRAPEPGDRPLVHRWLHDPEVMRYNSVRYPVSLGEMQSRDGPPPAGYGLAHFAVVLKESGERIGEVSLRTSTPENRSAELAVMLSPESRGQGIGTEVVALACQFGFDVMNLHRIELFVLAENARARRAYERVGFQLEGLRRHAFFWAGRYEDEALMGMLRGELRWPGKLT